MNRRRQRQHTIAHRKHIHRSEEEIVECTDLESSRRVLILKSILLVVVISKSDGECFEMESTTYNYRLAEVQLEHLGVSFAEPQCSA
jgi:hypothetical protein